MKTSGIIKECLSISEDELMAWGEKVGALIQKQDVLILTGDLGAGKQPSPKV